MNRILCVTVLILGCAMLFFTVFSLKDRIGIVQWSAAQMDQPILQKEKSDQQGGDGDEDEQSVAQLEGLLKPIISNGVKG